MLGAFFLVLGAILKISIVISQLIWYIGVCGSSILGGSIGGIRSGCVRVRGGVKCVFIINFIFLVFLVFCGDGRVGGEFAIPQ